MGKSDSKEEMPRNQRNGSQDAERLDYQCELCKRAIYVSDGWSSETRTVRTRRPRQGLIPHLGVRVFPTHLTWSSLGPPDSSRCCDWELLSHVLVAAVMVLVFPTWGELHSLILLSLVSDMMAFWSNACLIRSVQGTVLAGH